MSPFTNSGSCRQIWQTWQNPATSDVFECTRRQFVRTYLDPMLDLKLPKIDRLEVLRRFKSHPRFGTIPVIILTTSAELQNVQQADEHGRNSCIVTRVDFDKFVDVPSQIDNLLVRLEYPGKVETCGSCTLKTT